MNILFAETLKKLRTNTGLSQRELADRMYVTRSTVARWESGSRLPDAVMISRLARCLNIDVNTLLSAATESDDIPNVIMVDDRKMFLSGALPVLEEVMPGAIITGFTRPSEAIEYAKANRVALAFLDIEMGKTNGLDLCRTLLALNPNTNVVYLTAHVEYSFDAWSTGASGFLLKPIAPEAVRAQLKNLRHPFLHAEGAPSRPWPSGDANAARRAPAPPLGHPWPSEGANATRPATRELVPGGGEAELIPLGTTRNEVELLVPGGGDAKRSEASPLGDEADPATNHSGQGSELHIALANIRERLAMMCGGKLTIQPREGGGTTVKVTIP